ncbi:hypothetical protein BBM45_13230 [Vibrio parahaemolyticus]|uniref:hypothetical protein n=1 Tax=Vibrio parahaemolyticus TaxID=670 RepID=UPI00084AFD05|nr:hypothetical protein [Vibrio parahaemolyticus]ODZ73137.1 hypothetical protein BBM45_13230 [Vibrio parahaemolyticus]
MALIDDIESAKELWKRGTILTKVFIVVSTFLATGAIASLSDVVFAWKGFILDGINFYRYLVVSPLTQLAELFGLRVDATEANFLILTGLFMSAIYRKVWVTSQIGMKMLSGLAMFATLGLVTYLAGNSNDVDKNESVLFLYLVLCLIYPILRGFSKHEKIAYYQPIVTALVINFIAAAINSGLTR